MKKLYLFIFILLVFSLLGSSCAKEFDYNSDVNQTGGSFDKSNPKADNKDLATISHIEARQLVQDWLDQHPDMATPYEPTRIAGMEDEVYTYNAREYYIFDLSGYYWLDILVDLETGEFLARVWEESDEPVEPLIEPLMDYYNRYYD